MGDLEEALFCIGDVVGERLFNGETSSRLWEAESPEGIVFDGSAFSSLLSLIDASKREIRASLLPNNNT